MKKIPYFPGCTLHETAKGFDLTAREAMKVLDVELSELPEWNCCGTVYPLADDALMNQLAAVRILARAKDHAKEIGSEPVLTTLCSMCFQTVKRSNEFIKKDSEKQERINLFMELEEDYKGEVETRHLLEILRTMDFKKVAEKVKKPLKDLKLMPYYGCLLLRPKEIAIDEPDMPTVLGDLIESLGGENIDSPFGTECCGSFHSLSSKGSVKECVKKINESAKKCGAEAIVTSCPLCHFNLEERGGKLPVLYFTQLMALAFGLDPEICRFETHKKNPASLLKGKGLV